MISLSKFLFFCMVIFLVKPTFSQQSYDSSNCDSHSQVQGSNYLCSSKISDCGAYIVYRAQENFNTIALISSLFNVNQSTLLFVNKVAENDSSWGLPLGQEIIIPITCHCLGGFSKFIFIYAMSGEDSFASVACEVFAGLVKVQSLIEENPDFDVHDIPVGSLINVPIRCTCPDSQQRSNGVKYLVTYPILEKDSFDLIASKFGLPEEKIRDANNLTPYAAIFPRTTLLIPIKDVPEVRWHVGSFPEISPAPRAAIPLEKVLPDTKSTTWTLHLFLGIGVSVAVVMMIVACGVLICIRIRYHPGRFQPLPPRSSVSSNVSPDFLDGMSKLKQSLINFSLEELRIATEDFNESSMIGTDVYIGKIRGYYLAIEQMESEEGARHAIYILTKINHLNIVKLEGICNGTNPYLVYEFAENGSLRDCLSNVKLARQLTWLRRMQISFDLAEALHYLHFCTTPAFVHQNIKTRNVLITANWRVKISGFRLAKPVISDEEKEDVDWNKYMTPGREAGHWAPEYLTNGLASLQVDVFAFGVVLLELISGKDFIRDGKILEDPVHLLFDGGFEDSSHCLEKLKEFMDPVLEGDYSLGDAMCLAFVAKGCMEEDAHHRPTMNDVLKALSRIV